jgi:uncharacterized protein (DUF1800 family)
MLRDNALGNFKDIRHDRQRLRCWSGSTADQHQGQAAENFSREIMELFTVVGNYTEADVYAWRVFSGWNLARRYAADGSPAL